MIIDIKPHQFVLADEATTYHESIRGIIYRRVLQGCRDSDDPVLQVMGEDANPPWNYATSVAVLVSNTAGLPLAGVSSEEHLEGFKTWLALPKRFTASLLQEANNLHNPKTPEEIEKSTDKNPTSGDKSSEI